MRKAPAFRQGEVAAELRLVQATALGSEERLRRAFELALRAARNGLGLGADARPPGGDPTDAGQSPRSPVGGHARHCQARRRAVATLAEARQQLAEQLEQRKETLLPPPLKRHARAGVGQPRPPIVPVAARTKGRPSARRGKPRPP